VKFSSYIAALTLATLLTLKPAPCVAQRVQLWTTTDTITINPTLPPFIISWTFVSGDEFEYRFKISMLGKPGWKKNFRMTTGFLADEPVFDDVNLDGYKDISVTFGTGLGATEDTRVYLFDLSDSSFHESEEFEGLRLNPRDSTLYGTYTTGAFSGGSVTYRLVNGHPALIQRQESGIGFFTEVDDSLNGSTAVLETSKATYDTNYTESGLRGLEFDTVTVLKDGERLITRIEKLKMSPLSPNEWDEPKSVPIDLEIRSYSKDSQGVFYTFIISKAKHGKMVTIRKGKVYLNKK
jgi:hypothetical protein